MRRAKIGEVQSNENKQLKSSHVLRIQELVETRHGKARVYF
jgi:hypothetical protein